MDNAENTKGLSDPTIIWWDEINKGTQEDFTTLNALLRTPLNNKLQFIISFNPVSESSWLRKYFFSQDNAYQLKPEIENAYINHSTYLDNDFIDKDAYIKTLEINALGNVNRMIVDIKGLWGTILNNNPFFYALIVQNITYRTMILKLVMPM
jgi:phage terminase large subunit